MPQHARQFSARALWCAALTACAAVVLPAPAAGHGGSTLAEGQKGGVTVLVQGSEATTAGGKPAADLATTLAGPGSGAGSTVVYYVRPDGGKSIRVATERDESGVHHADVATAARGDWRAWDVSAIVTLNGGKRLRVTNAASNPPGPDPAQASRPESADEDGAASSTPGAAATTTPDTAAAPTSGTTPPEEQADAAIDDISGEDDAAPSWMLPSLAGLVLVGVGALVVARRRRGDDEPDGDEF